MKRHYSDGRNPTLEVALAEHMHLDDLKNHVRRHRREVAINDIRPDAKSCRGKRGENRVYRGAVDAGRRVGPGLAAFDRLCARIDDSTVAESFAVSFRASRLALGAGMGMMYRLMYISEKGDE